MLVEQMPVAKVISKKTAQLHWCANQRLSRFQIQNQGLNLHDLFFSPFQFGFGQC
jgi:hypothetical protein